MRILNPPVEYLVMFSEDLCPSGHGVRSFRSYYHQTSRKMDPKSLSSNLPIHPSHKLSICSALNPPPPPTPCTAQQRWSFGCRCFFLRESAVSRSLISSMLRLKALPDSRTASGVKRSKPYAPIITWSSSQLVNGYRPYFPPTYFNLSFSGTNGKRFWRKVG